MSYPNGCCPVGVPGNTNEMAWLPVVTLLSEISQLSRLACASSMLKRAEVGSLSVPPNMFPNNVSRSRLCSRSKGGIVPWNLKRDQVMLNQSGRIPVAVRHQAT